MLNFCIKILSQRPNLLLTFKALSYFISEKVLRVLIGFFLHAWMARELGPEEMGFFSYVTDFAFLFFSLMTFGMDELLVKGMSSKEEPEALLGTVFYFRCFMSLITWVAIAVSIFLIRRESPLLVLTIILYSTIIFFRSFDTFSSYFHSKSLIRPLVQTRQMVYILTSFLKGLGLWLSFNVYYFLFNYYLLLATESLAIFFRFKWIDKRKLIFSWPLLKQLVPIALPLALTRFFLVAESRIGTFFISKYYTLSLVGEYGVGRSLLDLLVFLPETICLIVFPILIKEKTSDELKYTTKMIKLFSALFYLGVIFAIFISLASDQITYLLFGNKYNQTAHILKYGSYFSIIAYINSARVRWYILRDETFLWLLIVTLSFIVNFCSQFYFTQEFGLIGPYASYAFSHIFSLLLLSSISNVVKAEASLVFEGILFPFKRKNWNETVCKFFKGLK